ncbi:hypothetical protein AAFN90_00825 [Erwiniaceae bacterium CAU 1747]
MKSGVTVRTDNAQAIIDSLKALTRKDVLVGIPEAESAREDGEFGNAGIGYINENGSPAQNIPPRPHLKPGVASVQQQYLPHLKAAAQKALSGDQEGAIRSLEAAGTVAANGVKRYITVTGFTPLADTTLAARQRRGRTGDKPLIDTGEYRRSITHIVRDKDADA